MSAAACVPLTITQDNCLAACGIEPRRFLALKLRLVRADVLLAALEREPEQAEQQPIEPETSKTRLLRAAGLA